MEKWSRFFKSAGIGLLASLVDYSVLLSLVNFLKLSPVLANIPSLLMGAVIQFWGCKYFAFKSGAVPLHQQLPAFIFAELATLTLNAFFFHALVSWLQVPYVLARPIGAFAVFAFFSYPMWTWVFRQAQS